MVTGQAFTPTARILWDGAALPTRFESETQLAADIATSRFTKPGPVAITVTRTDQQATGALMLNVNPALDWITQSTLPPAALNLFYSQALSVSGGTAPVRFSLVSGSIPPGLHLDGYNGTLLGYATAYGSYQLTLRATDSGGATITQSFNLNVAAELRVTSGPELPPATVGQAYSAQLSCEGGTPPVVEWKIIAGALPRGIVLDEKTGRLAGTPTGSPALAQFTLRVRDSAGRLATRALALDVRAPLSITLPATLTGLAEGDPLELKPAASGGTAPYGWSLESGQLPPGVALNAVTGVIRGSLEKSGSYRAVLRVRDAAGAEARTAFEVPVAAKLTIGEPAPVTGVVGSPFTLTLTASGGAPPYTWNLASGTLPDGIRFSEGRIDGQPRAAGTATIAVEVRDLAKHTAGATIRLSVTSPPLPSLQLAPLSPLRPAQQTRLDLRLDRAYPSDLDLTVALAFDGPADPAILLSTGGRQTKLVIPAGQVAPAPPLQLQTGTTAGFITVEAKLATQSAVQTARVEPMPPQIRALQLEKTTGGFAIVVSAFSPTREADSAVFAFDDALQIKVPIRDLTGAWYADERSASYGTSFTYRQNFTVSGDISRLRGVSVSLTNQVGSSTPVSVAF
jgi:hypothetical protein